MFIRFAFVENVWCKRTNLLICHPDGNVQSSGWNASLRKCPMLLPGAGTAAVWWVAPTLNALKHWHGLNSHPVGQGFRQSTGRWLSLLHDVKTSDGRLKAPHSCLYKYGHNCAHSEELFSVSISQTFQHGGLEGGRLPTWRLGLSRCRCRDRVMWNSIPLCNLAQKPCIIAPQNSIRTITQVHQV